MTKIIQKENPILREIAKEVPPEEISSEDIQNIIQNMKDVLAKQEDGVALAAPQIGISLRIFIVSPEVFSVDEDENLTDNPHLVYINPKITKLSQKKHSIDEGCLSVRGWYGKVKRSEKTTVEAMNEKGEKFQRGASSLLAQIFQHETDHLNGVLFTDKVKHLKEIEKNGDHEE